MQQVDQSTVSFYPRGSSRKLSKNFRVSEFQCPCGCSGDFPIDGKLVEILQKLREHFGLPVHISSAYRCANHNARVGGSAKSNHTKGMAADIWIEQYLYEPRIIAQYAESIGIRGIGLYEGSKGMWFVHVDTRTKPFFWESHKNTPVDSFADPAVDLSLRVLKKGTKGEDVAALQRLLGCQSPPPVIDGRFGAATEKALKAYQKAQGLTVDGSCGKITWSRLLGRA